MSQKIVGDTFRQFKIREQKTWNIIDQFLVLNRKDGKRIPFSLQLQAAIFILSRLYPEKSDNDKKDFAQQIFIHINEKTGESGGIGNFVRFASCPDASAEEQTEISSDSSRA